MRKTWLLAILALLAFWGSALVLIYYSKEKHVNPCTANVGNCYSIQGLYSQIHCPGQHEMRVEVDGQSYFLECTL